MQSQGSADVGGGSSSLMRTVMEAAPPSEPKPNSPRFHRVQEDRSRDLQSIAQQQEAAASRDELNLLVDELRASEMKESVLRDQLRLAEQQLNQLDRDKLEAVQALTAAELDELRKESKDVTDEEQRVEMELRRLEEEASSYISRMKRQNVQGSMSLPKHLADKQKQIALEHGQAMLQLSQQRTRLAQERNVLVTKLPDSSPASESGSGATSAASDLIAKLQDKYASDMSRLQVLRRDLEATKSHDAEQALKGVIPASQRAVPDRVMAPDVLPPTAKQTHSSHHLSNRSPQNDFSTSRKSRPPAMKTVQFDDDAEEESKAAPRVHSKQSVSPNQSSLSDSAAGRQTAVQQPSTVHSAVSPAAVLQGNSFSPSGQASIHPLAAEATSMLAEYMQQGGGNPAVISTLTALQREAQSLQQQVPTNATSSGGFPATAPVMMQPPIQTESNALTQMLQRQLDNNSNILREQEEQGRRLQEQLKAMQDSVHSSRPDDAVSALLRRTEAAVSNIAGERAQTPDKVMQDRRGMKDGLFGGILQEEAELRELERLPSNSELYKIRRKHLEGMLALRYEMQRVQQQSQLDGLKREVEDLAEQRSKAEWEREQEKTLLEARFRRQLAKENPVSIGHPDLADLRQPDGSLYDPGKGFICFWDYALGLPAGVQSARIVYGFVESHRGAARSQPKAMQPVETEPMSGLLSRAVFALRRGFTKVAADDEYSCVMELQSMQSQGKDTKGRSIAWTVLKLFRQSELFAGLWKLPLLYPPVRSDLPMERIAKLPRLPSCNIFVRLVPTQQGEAQSTLSLDPEGMQGIYHSPPYWPEVAITRKLDGGPSKHSDHQSPLKDDPASPSHAPAPSLEPPGGKDMNSNPSAIMPKLSISQDETQTNLTVCPLFVSGIDEHMISSAFSKGTKKLVAFLAVYVGSEPVLAERLATNGNVSLTTSKSTLTGSFVALECPFIAADQTMGTQPSAESSFATIRFSSKSSMPQLVVSIFEQQGEGVAADVGNLLAWSVRPLKKRSLSISSLASARSQAKRLLGKLSSRSRQSSRSKSTLLLSRNDSDSDDDNPDKNADEVSTHFGHFKSPLFKPPLSLDSDRNVIPGGFIQLSIMDQPPVDLPNVNPSASQEPKQPATVQEGAPTVREEPKPATPKQPPVDEQIFKSNPNNPVSNTLATASDGIDLCVDCVRYNPDNATVTVVGAMLMPSKPRSKPLGHYSFIPSSAGNCRCPQYNSGLFELRQSDENGLVQHKTAHFLFQIVTIDLHSKDVKCVGFSILPAYLDIATGQPATNSTNECVLNEGAFQLRVRHGSPKTSIDLSEKSLDWAPYVPCCTVCLRIRQAPRSEDGAAVLSRLDQALTDAQRSLFTEFEKRPSYLEASYASSSCSPSAIESQLYPIQHKRQALTCSEALEKVDISVDGDINDDKLEDVAKEKLLPALDRGAAMLDLRFANQALPNLGIRFSVDAASNLPKITGPTFPVVSLVPPTTFYADPPLTEGIRVWGQLGPEVDVRCPEYADGFASFTEMSSDTLQHKLLAVVEINTVITSKLGLFGRNKLKEPKVETIGWGIMPLLGSKLGYTLSGNYQIPLFKGRPDQETLEAFKIGSVSGTCNEMIESKQLEPIRWASVHVRVECGTRPEECSLPANTPGVLLRTEYCDAVEVPNVERIDYDPVKYGGPLRKLMLNKKGDFGEWNLDMLQFLKAERLNNGSLNLVGTVNAGADDSTESSGNKAKENDTGSDNEESSTDA